MPVAQRKRLEKPATEVVRGPDGHTFGERLRACMEARGRELGRKYTQTDLVRDMNRIVGRTASDEPVITQQAISLILNNERSESGATAIMAAVFGVEALWLGFGIGPRTYVESALKKAR